MARRVPRRGEDEGMSISSTVHQGGEMVSEWKERQMVNSVVHLAETEGKNAQQLQLDDIEGALRITKCDATQDDKVLM
jgi:hypothetical protein